MSDGNFSSEILADLRTSAKRVWIALFVVIALWFISIGAFLIYIWNTEEYYVEATGIYTAVDSNGNIVSQDVEPETWKLFLEWAELNGQSKSEP